MLMAVTKSKYPAQRTSKDRQKQLAAFIGSLQPTRNGFESLVSECKVSSDMAIFCGDGKSEYEIRRGAFDQFRVKHGISLKRIGEFV